MLLVYPDAGQLRSGFARPIVQTLFWASCLLSVVSFYTTQQGMALYLSAWFSFAAALGIQISLVMVAWLVGFTRRAKGLLIAVYIVTALVSIAFSYVSLYTWFASRERPALMQRALYDELTATAAKSEQLLSQAIATAHRHVLALEEMTAAEKSHGRISKARDADPYLDRIREAVAREAQTYDANYREGSGEGVRYTAFDRYTKLTRQSASELEAARQALQRAKGELKPSMSAEQQLRQFRQASDAIPWASVEQILNKANLDRPAPPAYSRFVENSASGQEDMMRSFEELFTAPNPRHVFSLALAAFIDLIVFLLAYSCGPYFHGDPEYRWYAAGATLDSIDHQLFARGLLRKMRPGHRGMPRVDAADLTPGEQQLCLLLVSKGQAIVHEEDGQTHYLISAETHERLLDSLASPGLPLKAASW